MYNFKIKSRINGIYHVNFIDNLLSQFIEEVKDENKIFIIDKKVQKYFSTEIQIITQKSRYILIESAENTKTLEFSQKIIKELINLNIRKDNLLVAIGGGITQDLVAFISSIIFRGIKWNFFPTTLLAQCDSCIGSKSSINFDKFKNLLGTFNPPSNIYIYPSFLDSLSEMEIKSGIGEMLHYFFTEGLDLPQKISDEYELLLKDRSKLSFYINNSLRIKKNIIEIDEFDTSIRHIFNYGHTFGHAIEAITNYEIFHGQAITIGMDIANFISFKLKYINKYEYEQLHNILIKNMPKFNLNVTNIDLYIQALTKDKKNKNNKLGCVLCFGIGKIEKTFIDFDAALHQNLLEYSTYNI